MFLLFFGAEGSSSTTLELCVLEASWFCPVCGDYKSGLIFNLFLVFGFPVSGGPDSLVGLCLLELCVFATGLLICTDFALRDHLT